MAGLGMECEPSWNSTLRAGLNAAWSGVMTVLESLKEQVERITGWSRPTPADVAAAVRPRKPTTFCFKDDGVVPNNPMLALVLYRTPVRLADKKFDPPLCSRSCSKQCKSSL